MSRRIGSAIGIVATLALVGAAWFFLAPTQLGGRTSYAVTFGVSMEPHFHHGDLVVLRKRAHYAVGDVVAYRSHDLHKNVLHRIIAIHDGRYTFKGDNNSWTDPERPAAADLIGSEWLHVGGAGNWVSALHKPVDAAVVSGLAVLLLVLSGGGAAAHRRRRRTRGPRQSRVPDAAPSLGFAVAALGGGALVAAALLGVVAFTKPVHRPLVRAGLYEQRGQFAYSAAVPAGAAYQRPAVRSGDPVYLKLVHRLPVSFGYRFQAASRGPLAGDARLDAVVADDQGWTHRLPVAAQSTFTGPATTLRGVLDLARVRRVIAAFERETGEHNTLYHVRLAARVRIHGTVAERPLVTRFAPVLAFDLDQLRLTVSAAGASAAGTPSNTLVQTAAGTGAEIETVTLHALGRSVTVARARRLATLLALCGLAVGIAGWLVTLLGGSSHEAAAIRRRYEDWIVDVVPTERPGASERRVASMEALARLAEQYDRLILHERRDEADAFLVEDDGIVYAYAVTR